MSVGAPLRMDWSETERRPAQRTEDQVEPEGSRSEQRAKREHDKEAEKNV